MNDKDILLNSFLNRTFFKSWKGNIPTNYDNLELITTNKCSLSCKYCYFNNFGNELFTEESRNEDNIFEGFKKVVEWLTRNNYHPRLAFFSGEFFQQPINVKLIYYLLDHIPPGIKLICIPVSGTFMLYNDGEEIIQLQKRFQEKGVLLYFSLSVDGKYMDFNRPTRDKLYRDDNYYDKIFKFALQTGSGFHPMVYSEGIQYWQKNFLWFQEKFKEFGLVYSGIYLLEVRNNNWSNEQINEFGKFINFLINWLWDESNHDKDSFFFNLKCNNFNILRSPLLTIGRGLTCSIQTSVFLRLGDLSLFPCHRTMRDGFKIGTFNIEDNIITDLKAHNSELAILINSIDKNSIPLCETCLIKDLCPGQCLGSSLEVHGDMFAPIPTVCKLEHIKIFSILSSIKKLNLYQDFLNFSGQKAKNIILLEESLC